MNKITDKNSYLDSIKNRNLKIYGSKSKKLNDTLEFILNRKK